MKTSRLIIITILIIAAFLRLYKLSSRPSFLTPDEAALGYNAYSILQTGRDEYGQFLPLVFKSFGDYKPGLYVYLTTPFVALLGINAWSVRLPAALSGVLAVWLVHQITQLIFPHQRIKLRNLEFEIGYLTALVLALSPWHIQFSRGAWESQVALTLTLLAIYLFLKSLASQKMNLSRGYKGNQLYLALLLFGLTTWTYQGAKISTPLVLIALFAAYAKPILSRFTKKQLGLAFLAITIVVLPIALGLFFGTAGRIKAKNIFSYHRPSDLIQQTILEPAHISQTSLTYILYHSEALSYVRSIVSRYFNYFSARFLVAEGDWEHPQLTPAYMGVIYWTNILALLFGFYYLSRQKSPFAKFLLGWMILAPLSGALTLDQINSVRTLYLVAPLTFIIGFGWFQIIKIAASQPQLVKISSGLLLLFIYLFQVCYYLDSYYVLSPQITTQAAQGYGYQQIVQALQPYRSTANHIIVQQSYDQPYIYFLFYEHSDPRVYQSLAHLEENRFGDVGLVERIDNQIEFRNFSLNAEKHLVGNIYVGDPGHIPDSLINNSQKFITVANILYPNHQTAFRIVQIIN